MNIVNPLSFILVASSAAKIGAAPLVDGLHVRGLEALYLGVHFNFPFAARLRYSLAAFARIQPIERSILWACVFKSWYNSIGMRTANGRLFTNPPCSHGITVPVPRQEVSLVRFVSMTLGFGGKCSWQYRFL
jgi:hypothetical protein